MSVGMNRLKIYCPLLTTIKYIEHNTLVIMDNATFHKSLQTKALLDEKGCSLLFLPPYSPQLNPIVPLWAFLRACLKFF